MKCFEKNNVPPGYTPVEGSKCHATEEECAANCGPCWKCYERSTLEVCDLHEVSANLEVISVNGFNGVVIDTSVETGLPLGAKFILKSVRPNNPFCEFYFQYTSPETGSCRGSFNTATKHGIYCNVAKYPQIGFQTSVFGEGNDWVFLGDQQSACGNIPNNRGGKFPWFDSAWGGFGKHRFTVPVVDESTASTQIGEIVYEINVIDMSVDDPDIPADAYEYQCFDAQPTEDGWIATGDCHPDEPSCAADCPLTTTPIGARTMSNTKTTGGPGTELKRLLGSFGIQSKEKGCGCRSMQKKMDKPGWAVSHKKEIIDHLAAEAKKRRLPFIRLAAEKLVDLAIRRAEK